MEKLKFVQQLRELYEQALHHPVQIEDLQGENVIERQKIDSLIALQLIIAIEKAFSVVIDDDELAIQMIDNPSRLYEFVNNQ